jgi:formylglycine-generating enzyme required for sulfatase activity
MPFPLIALGIGSLITAAVGITNTALNKKNTEKAQKLQVEQHQAIVVREKERIDTQERIEYARLVCQTRQQQEGLAAQAQLAELSRDFQTYENALNRELQKTQQQEALSFQKVQKDLDRDLQVRLVELNQEFQSQQGELSRAFTEKIEVFKADMQKYFFEKQKELQIQLKAQDIDLARELRQFDRQTAIDVIHAQIREKNSAIWLVAEDLLKRGMYGDILPLNVFVSPPVLDYDDSRKPTNAKGFPEMEQYLKEELRQFFQQYQTHHRHIDYLAGAWTSKQFNSEAAARQIFLGLQSEPTLILESTLEGENLSISYAYWGLGDVKQRYDTCMRFSWLEVLYGFVKERTENWFRNRAEEGTSEAEWIADYGEEFVAKYQANQAVIKREQMWLNRGDDIRELARNYHIAPKDWDQLKRFVALCHIMIAGWVTDEYFLLNTSPDRHLLPLLPELLPGLLSGMSEETKRQFIDGSVQIYQALYEALIRQVPDWESELRLELAASLIKLPSHEAGIAQVNASLKVWLSYRGIDWHLSTPVMPLLVEVAKPEDESYFNSLYQVWELLGITDRVDMGNAYYRRGEDFYKRRDFEAACQDFERAIGLGYVKAAARREIVVQVQESIKDEKLKLLREQAKEQAFPQISQFISPPTNLPKPPTNTNLNINPTSSFTEDLGNGIKLEMIAIPGGTFLMGSPENEAERSSNESPQHQVTVPSFFMGKYQLTQAQYQAIMGVNLSAFKGDNRPVENVNWDDAVAFCQKLTQKTGKNYRLPSEAEWEYACRAGTKTPFSFGDNITTDLVNYDGNYPYNSAPKGKYRQETTDVGTFPPNAFGLYDMHGNVWEWCKDEWHENYMNAPTDGSVWNSLSGGDVRLLRGGSWSYDARSCRAAIRGRDLRGNRNDFYGFRVVSSFRTL